MVQTWPTPHGPLRMALVEISGHRVWWHYFGTYPDGSPQVSPLFARHADDHCPCTGAGIPRQRSGAGASVAALAT